MSKKNSSVNLKEGFQNLKDLSEIFLNFKKKLDNHKKRIFLVAVSGGPDSLALVALTKSYSYIRNAKFHYVLIDHNLRKNSSVEAKKVKNLLKKKKINLKIFKNLKKITKNVQAEARNIRYEILANYCKKNKINTIITAHNFEDQVETFLIRLSRGSGIKGLSGIKPLSKINNQSTLFRPLLDVKKKFLIKIAKSVFGEFIKDPSNKNMKFLRTKVRNLKKPLENSGIKYDQIFKSIQNLSLSKETLDDYFQKTSKELIKNKGGRITINIRKYMKLKMDTKITLLNQSIKLLKKNYYDLRSKKVENLIKNLNKADFKKHTLGGCIFFKKGQNLCLKIEKP